MKALVYSNSRIAFKEWVRDWSASAIFNELAATAELGGLKFYSLTKSDDYSRLAGMEFAFVILLARPPVDWIEPMRSRVRGIM